MCVSVCHDVLISLVELHSNSLSGFSKIARLKCPRQEHLAKLHFDGETSIPGFQKPVTQCPADLLEKPPPTPVLNCVTPSSEFYPVVPQTVIQAGAYILKCSCASLQSVVQAYATHTLFSDRFNKLMSEIVEEFGPMPEETAAADENKKKDGEGAEETEKDPKPVQAARGSPPLVRSPLPRRPSWRPRASTLWASMGSWLRFRCTLSSRRTAATTSSFMSRWATKST